MISSRISVSHSRRARDRDREDRDTAENLRSEKRVEKVSSAREVGDSDLVPSELSEQAADFTRELISFVRLERDPLEVVDHVLETVVHAGKRGGTPEDYREAIEQALASNIRLASLCPEYHPEVILRRFLTELRRRLMALN